MLNGVDVSKWQPKVNWTQLAQTHQFAFIKLTEGRSYTDPLAASHVSGSVAAGLMTGAYHFYHPSRDPVQQARHFAKTYKSFSAVFVLPPVIDLETDDSIYDEHGVCRRPGVPSNALRAGAQQFKTAAEQLLGRQLMLYTGPYFANVHSLAQVFSDRALWVAHYGVSRPKLPKGFAKWTFWQTTGHGRLTAVPGVDVDLNQFNGTNIDLAALVSA